MNERLLIKTERAIIAGIMKINSGKVTPAESGVGRLLNALKPFDEPLYDNLMLRYKNTLESR